MVFVDELWISPWREAVKGGVAGNPGEMGISENQEPFIRINEAAAPAALLRPGRHAPRSRSTVSPPPGIKHHPDAK